MKIVIALGGNALQKGKSLSSFDQITACRETASSIVDLLKEGHQIAIVHGNGPQVGEIVSDIELAHKADDSHPLLPFDVCDSFTQGYIGYHLQNALSEYLAKEGIHYQAASIITQVEVDKDDPAFNHPTKPIGFFYTAEEAQKLQKENGYHMSEDAGRGWRRVVPSPKPVSIVEEDVIKTVFESGHVVISCGGGGIPVVRDGEGYKGVEAVIDKDFAAAKLADVLDADLLMILTAVDKVYINYNQENQKALDEVTLHELENLIQEGHFAKGSMLPKVEAASKFVGARPGKKAVIADLYEAKKVFQGAGTWIKNNK